jgi:hypothetical protein
MFGFSFVIYVTFILTTAKAAVARRSVDMTGSTTR